MTGDAQLALRINAALDQLTRIQRHVVAQVIDPTFDDAREFYELVYGVSTLDADTVDGWLGRVAAYVKRVCPQVAGGVE